MNKQKYLLITFYSLDQAMALDAIVNQDQGRLIPKPSIVDAGCGMCFSCYHQDKIAWQKYLKDHQIKYEKIVEVMF